MLNQLPQHLFSREFIMCPWDFGVIPKNISNNIKIDGQEYVKVKPFKKRIVQLMRLLMITISYITTMLFPMNLMN